MTTSSRLVQIGPDNGGNCEHEWQGSYVQAHLLSDVGKKRAHNEDSCIFSVPRNETATSGGLLFAVADGMGGASAGELASRMTLQTIAEEYYLSSQRDNVPAVLVEAVQGANRRVYEHAASHDDFHGMGTTSSVVIVAGSWAYVAQVGDSRVYLGRGRGELYQITNDHSVVAEQVRSGLLTEEEARNHSLKNLITRAVGIREAVQPDLFAVNLKRGDTLLICSDGLSNMVGDPEIAETLTHANLQAAARQLVGRALEEGGTDNITAAVVRITQTPPKTLLQEGAEEVALPSSGIFGKLRGFLQ